MQNRSKARTIACKIIVALRAEIMPSSLISSKKGGDCLGQWVFLDHMEMHALLLDAEDAVA